MRGRVHVGAGNRDVVAPVELDVRAAERSLGEVVERFEPLRELEVGIVDPEVSSRSDGSDSVARFSP